MSRVSDHIKRNVVGYVALFVALGGSGYAAIDISNHSITPAKLNPRYIGGYVRAWVSVNANGRVTASGGGVRVIPDPNVAPGHYIINWRPRPTSRCTAIGSVDFTRGPTPGYVTTDTGAQSAVQTYNPQGQPALRAFDVALVCSSPH
jgi:hypothetical protein